MRSRLSPASTAFAMAMGKVAKGNRKMLNKASAVKAVAARKEPPPLPRSAATLNDFLVNACSSCHGEAPRSLLLKVLS